MVYWVNRDKKVQIQLKNLRKVTLQYPDQSPLTRDGAPHILLFARR
jgi:hypothetical protein